MTSPSAPLSIRVAFIGLGIMGGPMAANLVKAGYDVVGYHRSPDPVRRLQDAGAPAVVDAAWSGPTTGCSPSGRT